MKRPTMLQQVLSSSVVSLFCFTASSSHALNVDDYADAVSKIQSVISERAPKISSPKHTPRLYLHGQKQPCVAVVTHGSYESPHYIQGISETFFGLGCNVYSILLPGHYAANLKDMDTVTDADWVHEVETAVADARPLGDDLFLVGFSLGGLLSTKYALEHPGEVKALALWAPALGMSPGSLVATFLGESLSLDGNDFTNMSPDGIDTPYYAPNLGVQVHHLETQLFKNVGSHHEKLYQQLHIPVSVVYTAVDLVISDDEIDHFVPALPDQKLVIKYPLTEGIGHPSVAKTPEDVYPYAQKNFDPHYMATHARVAAFFAQIFGY